MLFISTQFQAFCYSRVQGRRHTLSHSQLATSLALANEMEMVGTGESALMTVLPCTPASSVSKKKKYPNLLIVLEGRGMESRAKLGPIKVTPQPVYADTRKQLKTERSLCRLVDQEVKKKKS